MQTAGQPQIGIRRIDADEHVRPFRQEHSFDARQQLGEPRQIAQHIEQAHDREATPPAPRLSQPAASIFGPATPKNFAFGARRRSASIRSAPNVSPEASPATQTHSQRLGHPGFR